MNHRFLTSVAALPVLLLAVQTHAEPAPAADTPTSPAVKASASASDPPAAAPAIEPKKDAAPSLSRWQMTFYGFLELDGMADTTQSFGDSPNNSPLLRSDGSSPAYLPLGTNPYGVSYGAKHSRLQATARNSRF